MPEDVNMLTLVRNVARIKMLFLPHALQQMMRPDRMISRHEIRSVVEVGDVIEDYPADPRGHSCLLLGFGAGRVGYSRCLFASGGLSCRHHSISAGHDPMVG